MRKTDLYRHYDESGDLLYVGISLGAVGRLQYHRKKSGWFEEIAKVTIEKFESAEAARAAEAEAIRAENPKHNILRPMTPEWPSDEVLDQALFIWDALPAKEALAMIERRHGVKTNRNHMNHQRRKRARAKLGKVKP